MKGINVVSTFDGMGCLMIALQELDIKVNKYFAVEVDKFAIQQTKHNFPNIIHLGDITKVKESDFQGETIDLFAGGSPCQGFSFAGKQLNFEDPRSVLFFEYVRLWRTIKARNPKAIFLLENVNMKKEFMRVISEHLEVFPVRINSNLVSAQNRDRQYWSNIKIKEVGLFGEKYTDVKQPDDRGILLKDIFQDESEINKKYFIKNVSKYDFKDAAPGGIVSDRKTIKNRDKAVCLDAHYYKGIVNHQERTGVCVAMVGRKLDENGTRKDNDPNIKAVQQLEPQRSGKTNCLTSVSKDNLILQLNPSKESGGKQPYQQNRVYDTEGITPALSTGVSPLIQENYSLRRLTPTECARLQTVPNWYKWTVSDTQQYKMLGNGWTIEVIKHILKPLK